MVIFDSVIDSSGSRGLGALQADDEEEMRAFAARDPVVTTGTGAIEVGQMLAGFARPRPPARRPRTSSASAPDQPDLARRQRSRSRADLRP
jgi:hypothetical protein